MIIKNGSAVILAGRLVKDATHKQFNDKEVTTLSVSYEYHTDGGGIMNIDCWREMARATAPLKKGDRVIAAGVLKSNDYNGKTYYTVTAECVVKCLEPVADANGFTDINITDGSLPF